MTGLEMQLYFENMLQTSGIQFKYDEKPDTDTIFKYLNEAQDLIIRTKYLPYQNSVDNIKVLNKFELELHKLVTRKIISLIPIQDFEYMFIAQLPSDYYYYIRSSLVISRVSIYACNNSYISLNYRDQSEMHKFITNRFNTVILRTPAVFVTNSLQLDSNSVNNNVVLQSNLLNIVVVTDKFTTITGNLNLTYLAKPSIISLNSECKLSPQVHVEIVIKAFELFMNFYKKLELQNNNNQPKQEDIN